MSIHHNAVFTLLMQTMESDNACYFPYTAEDRAKAEVPIRALVEQGYFQDDPLDLDGSFWRFFGESTEAPEYFKRDSGSYQALSDLFNDIFDRPTDLDT